MITKAELTTGLIWVEWTIQLDGGDAYVTERWLDPSTSNGTLRFGPMPHMQVDQLIAERRTYIEATWQRLTSTRAA